MSVYITSLKLEQMGTELVIVAAWMDSQSDHWMWCYPKLLAKANPIHFPLQCSTPQSLFSIAQALLPAQPCGPLYPEIGIPAA